MKQLVPLRSSRSASLGRWLMRLLLASNPLRSSSIGRWLMLMGLFVILLLGRTTRAAAQVVVTVGVGGSYATVNDALQSLPATLPVAYELQLLAGTYPEDITITRAFTAAAPLTIKPAPGASVVVEGTLQLADGAANVTISGNNGLATRTLTLRQTSIGRTTLLLSGDAQSIVVSDAVIEGANGSDLGGVVVLGSGTTTGHDAIVLSNNLLTNSSTTDLPVNLIYAANATAGTLNEQITISGNELRNFSGSGVRVLSGNGSNWSITNNSFYYNASLIPTTEQAAIRFEPGTNSNDNSITNNTIGGRTALAGSGIWENQGFNDFYGIVVKCGTGTNLVSGNVIKNINLSRQNTNQAFTGLLVESGRAELASNTLTAISNSGTEGVNSLVARGTVILSSYTVNAGQIMSVEQGLTQVTANLINNGILNHTGGNILILGDFTNNGTFAQTLGDTEVRGDMINRNIFNCTTGSVKLTGNRNQKVSGGAYFNLEVNGTGTKTLTGDMTVYNGIQMTTGILATDRYLINLGLLANVVESETSYILGSLKVDGRAPSYGQTENFGNIGLTLTPAAGSLLPGYMTVIRQTGTAIAKQMTKYYDISADVNGGLDLTMTMSYFDREVAAVDVAKLQFLKSTDNGGYWAAQGIDGLAGRVATLDGVSGFSRWTLGEVEKPLPVAMQSFTARAEGTKAVLTWATASELDSRMFTVEVSTDGRTYRRLGQVAAHGQASQYRFVDEEAGKSGIRYYRLHQLDVNGRAAYYGPRSVSFGAAALALAAFPNPFHGELKLELRTPAAGSATLRLTDALGRTVWSSRQATQAGANVVTLLPACAPGTYLLEAELNGQRLHQRVVCR